MKIQVRINNEDVLLDAPPDESLLSVLRQRGLTGVKCGCDTGLCGACTVLLDGRPLPSCKVAVALVRGSEIITLDYFISTPLYAVIMAAFEAEGVSFCGFCDAGKIFAAFQALQTRAPLESRQIAALVGHLSCRCADIDRVVAAIVRAAKEEAA